MDLERVIAEAIDEKTRAVAAPSLDVATLTRRGKRRLTVQRAGIALVAAALLVATGGVLSMGEQARPTETPGDPLVLVAGGPMEYGDGLRAYMSPGSDEIRLGGATVSIKNAWHLDTDAIATPHGLVGFESNRRPYLLKEDGSLTYLGAAPEAPDDGYRPRAKSDAKRPLVAWGEYDGGKAVTIRLHNLVTGESVDDLQVPCASQKECRKVRVEALDHGLVFVRAPKGNYVWDPAADGDAGWTYLGGSTIADVRNRVIMMTGALPVRADLAADHPIGRAECDSHDAECDTGEHGRWRFVQGEIDAQLSYDGRWKLYWSNKLEPTSDRDQAVTLDVPTRGFHTFDTDGSVLVALRGGGHESAHGVGGAPPSRGKGASEGISVHLPRPGSAPVFRFYDCELPSGTCVEIDRMEVVGGDPVFIGNDM